MTMKKKDTNTTPGGARRKAPPQKQGGLRGLSLVLALLLAFCSGGVCSWLLFRAPQSGGAEPQDESGGVSAVSAAEESAQPEASASDPGAEPDVDPGAEAASAAESAPAESASSEDPELDAVSLRAEQILGEMTLEEKLYQLFVVTPEQLTGSDDPVTQADEAVKAALEAHPVGGVIYMENNLETPEQVTSLSAALQADSKYGLFLAVDEEGGRVARFGNNAALGTTSFPAMLELGQQGTDAVQRAMTTIATEVGAFGVNLDFAPVADVYTNPENTVIGDRAFSTDAETAAALVEAAVTGFRQGGMLCTLKHFPGHGDTQGDSHTEAVYTDKTLEELRETEFLPFQAGIAAGAEFVMVGHICTPNITDSTTPATLSYTMVTEILRGELGFDGIVITDGMNMSAITAYYNSGEAAVQAVQAGVDLILMPNSLEGAVAGLQAAVESGELSEERIDESVLRILLCKLRQGILPTD